MCFEFNSPDFIESLSDVVDAENEEEREKKEIELRLEALEKRWQSERLERRHRNHGTKNYPTGHVKRGGPSTERYSGELRSTTNKRRRRDDTEAVNEGLRELVEVNDGDNEAKTVVLSNKPKPAPTRVIRKNRKGPLNDDEKVTDTDKPELNTGEKNNDDVPSWMFSRDPTRRF